MTARNPSRRGWLDGQAFIAHRLEMIRSPAWQAMPIPLGRIIERLEVEHMAHAGTQNGRLLVAFSHFEAYGVSKRKIKALLELGEALGLLKVGRHPDDTKWDIRPPNTYLLTYIPEQGKRAPTDEWRSIGQERADALLALYRTNERERESRRSQEPDVDNEAAA